MSLNDYRQLVADLVRDKDQVVSSEGIALAIANAVLRYSDDVPRAVVVDQTAVAGYLQPLPAGWVADYSEIRFVETPIDLVPASLIDAAQTRIRNTPSGDTLELPNAMAAGETLRIAYTQRHVVDDTTDTVPLHHRLPVASLAGAIVCGQLQAYYASEGAPTIGADVADHQGKAERYRARARDLLADYNKTVGVTDAPVQSAAGTVVQLEGRDSLGGRRLFHSRRYGR